jgi:histidinol dehydrogenase
MQMKRFILSDEQPFSETMLDRSAAFDAKVLDSVTSIIAEVRKRGDAALRDYTERFDHVTLDDMCVGDEEIDAAFDAVSDEVVESIQFAATNIRRFHEEQRQRSWFITQQDGAVLGSRVTPVERAGVYVPGGRARYPSTVLMDTIPARVAGVGQVVMTTPPAQDGKVDAATLVAARIAGVDAVYRVGGAQAIAAMAYGTETIPRVDKIVGPGNVFVATAKKLVLGDVGIDMIAGPSEVCIIADETSTPEFVAIDLMAQAEHDPNAICYLACTSEDFVDEVEAYIESYIDESPREEITRSSLENNARVFVCRNVEEAVEVSNAIAPEHLEVQTADPTALLGRLRNAGAIFLGDYTPTSVGDYVAGPNHTLPTSGTARFSSPLSVDDFVKRSSVVNYTYDALDFAGNAIETIAGQEGLWAHARAVELRREIGDEYMDGLADAVADMVDAITFGADEEG